MFNYEIEVCLGKLCVSSFTSIFIAKIMKEGGGNFSTCFYPFWTLFFLGNKRILKVDILTFYLITKATFGVQPDQFLGLFIVQVPKIIFSQNIINYESPLSSFWYEK